MVLYPNVRTRYTHQSHYFAVRYEVLVSFCATEVVAGRESVESSSPVAKKKRPFRETHAVAKIEIYETAEIETLLEKRVHGLE